MQRYLLLFAITVGLAVVATVIKASLNYDQISANPDGWPSTSIGDSERNGLFIHELQVLEPRITCNGREIELGRAWVEKKSIVEYRFWWFKTRKQVPGFQVVVECHNAGGSKIAFWSPNADRSFLRLHDRFCSPKYNVAPNDIVIIGREDGHPGDCFTLTLFKK